MEYYKKSDMVYHDYSWTVYRDDDPKVRGELDHTELNRKEGYEVKYFINKYMKDYGYTLTNTREKIEKMIRNKVPSSIRTQVKIKEWIHDHWKD